MFDIDILVLPETFPGEELERPRFFLQTPCFYIYSFLAGGLALLVGAKYRQVTSAPLSVNSTP